MEYSKDISEICKDHDDDHDAQLASVTHDQDTMLLLVLLLLLNGLSPPKRGCDEHKITKKTS